MFTNLEEMKSKLNDRQFARLDLLITNLNLLSVCETGDVKRIKALYKKYGISSIGDYRGKGKVLKEKIKELKKHINVSIGDIGNGRDGYRVLGMSEKAAQLRQVDEIIEKEHIVRVKETAEELVQMVKENVDGWGNLDPSNKYDQEKVFERIYYNSATIPVVEMRKPYPTISKERIRENTTLDDTRKEIMDTYFTDKDGNVDYIAFNTWTRGEMDYEDIPQGLRDSGLTDAMSVYGAHNIGIFYPTEQDKRMYYQSDKLYHIDLSEKYVEPYISKMANTSSRMRKKLSNDFRAILMEEQQKKAEKKLEKARKKSKVKHIEGLSDEFFGKMDLSKDGVL